MHTYINWLFFCQHNLQFLFFDLLARGTLIISRPCTARRLPAWPSSAPIVSSKTHLPQESCAHATPCAVSLTQNPPRIKFFSPGQPKSCQDENFWFRSDAFFPMWIMTQERRNKSKQSWLKKCISNDCWIEQNVVFECSLNELLLFLFLFEICFVIWFNKLKMLIVFLLFCWQEMLTNW